MLAPLSSLVVVTVYGVIRSWGRRAERREYPPSEKWQILTRILEFFKWFG